MQSGNVPAYHDLDIMISKRHGDFYDVYATSSLCGQASGRLQLPYGSYEEFTRKVNQVYITLQRAQEIMHYEATEQVLKSFGKELFASLIKDDIRELYLRSHERAKSMPKDTGLRLRLHIEAHELVRVPWEYLYDPAIRNYIAFYHHSPVVRYMNIQQPTVPSRVRLPLRLLCMISSPHHLPQLNVKREKQLMEMALKPLREKFEIDITWLDHDETYDDLQKHMRTAGWHIFHFIGHGGFDAQAGEGCIYVSDYLGEPHKVYASQLTPLLDWQRKTLKLVFLNTCQSATSDKEDMFSSIVGNLMINGVLSVIAMQQEITDRAAIVFSQQFYQAIAHNIPIDAALSEARNAMRNDPQSKLEWGIPVLYMRAPNGKLFEFTRRRQPSTTKSSASTISSTTTATRRSSRPSTRRRNASKKRPVQTLQEVGYAAPPGFFKRALPYAQKDTLADDFRALIGATFFDIGYYLRYYLNRHKYKKYVKGIRLPGYFFFLATDFFLPIGVIATWVHAPLFTVIAGMLTLIVFVLISINEHILAGIVYSLLPIVTWCLLGILYLHITPHIVIVVSLLFAYFRFIQFRPTGKKIP